MADLTWALDACLRLRPFKRELKGPVVASPFLIHKTVFFQVTSWNSVLGGVFFIQELFLPGLVHNLVY